MVSPCGTLAGHEEDSCRWGTTRNFPDFQPIGSSNETETNLWSRSFRLGFAFRITGYQEKHIYRNVQSKSIATPILQTIVENCNIEEGAEPITRAEQSSTRKMLL